MPGEKPQCFGVTSVGCQLPGRYPFLRSGDWHVWGSWWKPSTELAATSSLGRTALCNISKVTGVQGMALQQWLACMPVVRLMHGLW